jgi:hypothetical protein
MYFSLVCLLVFFEEYLVFFYLFIFYFLFFLFEEVF